MNSSNKSGRPRDPSVTRSIEKATLKVLGNDGYQALSILHIAKLSGVSSTAIYRRFPTKEHLVIHVVGKLYKSFSLKETGAFREDLIHAISTICAAAKNPVIHKTMPALLSALGEHSEIGTALMDAVILPRREFACGLIEHAIERGELSPDTNPVMLIDMLAGYVFYRTWTLHRPVGPEEVVDLVDFALRGSQST
ncbi:MAG: TetR/AcrR family transcriptional regulator [Pseudomonadota bacterium]|nr:TetR/AcrR family transcriptional regulator [Pseudomonadota bacterium]